eukprot:CAMPEP_0113633310 /NCGR_PEP_ID=MMETSP0017_2-20120614/17335_1 /TAXON_ID=2856 /ORGANISM="Cylindrotheca closterium" /LENGTH=381 /DNA_ID=CAMNT_0000543943 /DNA_START=1 /DNA_END=1146 /DNA_ORIENTATION=+ /assembly_acc=CAM_ASM_000147
MDSASAILKKTNPAELAQNVAAIESLIGDNDKAALQSFHHKNFLPFDPFTSIPPPEKGEKAEKPFLNSSYNKSDKGGYRSPWTNRYYLINKSATGIDIDIYEKPVPPQEEDLRHLEAIANEVWAAYTHLYYGHGAIGSVYMKPLEKGGAFEGLFGVHKRTSTEENGGGSWDSVHLVRVDEPDMTEGTCTYRVESAVVMSLSPHDGAQATISSSLTKDTVKTCNIRHSGMNGSHLENIGTILEDVEIDFRSRMERVTIPKTMDVVESIYRKQMVGSTVHLMKERTSMASGNAGAEMISEIADMANKKRSSAVMAAMELNERLRENNEKVAVDKDSNIAGDMLSDFKQNLKVSAPKSTLGVAPTPTPEFLNFRDKLTKGGSKR